MESGERRELSQWVRGRAPAAPAENEFWRILKDTERSFLYLYICPPTPNSWDLSLVPHVIYAHATSSTSTCLTWTDRWCDSCKTNYKVSVTQSHGVSHIISGGLYINVML